jgi:polyphosphate kinase
MQRIEDGYREPGYDGLRPDESLSASPPTFTSLSPPSTAAGTSTCSPSCASRASACWSGKSSANDARAFAQDYFQREVDPLLTPISIDPAHPFPRVLNKALCLALLLRAKRRSSGPQVLGVVTVPRACPASSACPPATAPSITCSSRT